MSLLHVVLMDVPYRLDFNISQAFSPYLLRYSVLHIIRFKQGLSKWNELKHWSEMVSRTKNPESSYIPECNSSH